MMIARLFSMIATVVFTERYKFRQTIAVEMQTFWNLTQGFLAVIGSQKIYNPEMPIPKNDKIEQI